MKKISRLLSIALIMGILLISLLQNVTAADSNTVAHWIFQNDAAFVEGNAANDNFKVKDVTGNGNTLTVGQQGNVSSDQLMWTSDGYNSAKSSLLLNNQIAFADSNASDSYVDIIPVAKWLETVSTSPINNMTFTKGFTIEIIFKVSLEYDAAYNRYSNLIERQGTVRGKYDDGATDPLFALATSSNSGDTLISEDNPVGSQLLQMSEDGEEWTNREGDAEFVPGKWYHMAAVNDGYETIVYINGEEAITSYGTGIATAGYGWDIGIGRKYNDKDDSTLGNDPKGVPRRAFCGQIAEVKISDAALSVSQFINTAKTDVSAYLQTDAPAADDPAPESSETSAPAVAETVEVAVPQTGTDTIFVAAALILSLILSVILTAKTSNRKKTTEKI